MIALLVLQLVGLGPFTAKWDPYSDPTATLRLYVDDGLVSEVSATLTSTTFSVPTIGAHTLGLSAVVNGREGVPTILAFTALQTDPCLPPLGAHAPAIFPTSVTVTTGKPGSRSFLNYQLGGPDAVAEVAIQIDGADVVVGRGADLKAFSGLWFTQPSSGTHTVGVRVLTAFGCALVKLAAPLTVK